MPLSLGEYNNATADIFFSTFSHNASWEVDFTLMMSPDSAVDCESTVSSQIDNKLYINSNSVMNESIKISYNSLYTLGSVSQRS